MIVLIGGAEDRENDKLIIKEIVKLGKRIAIIPTGLKKDPLESYDRYVNAFREFGVTPDVIDIRESDECDSEENLKELDKIDTVYFTGGDQVRLMNILGRSKFLDKLVKKVSEGKLNYVGTSAGAMSAGTNIIYDGDYKGMLKGFLKTDEGFDILKDILIDTHFNKRHRFCRLSQGLMENVGKIGIGLCEDTALFIDTDLLCKVVGNKDVFILDVRNSKNDYKEKCDGEIFSAQGINVSVYGNGASFKLVG